MRNSYAAEAGKCYVTILRQTVAVEGILHGPSLAAATTRSFRFIVITGLLQNANSPQLGDDVRCLLRILCDLEHGPANGFAEGLVRYGATRLGEYAEH